MGTYLPVKQEDAMGDDVSSMENGRNNNCEGLQGTSDGTFSKENLLNSVQAGDETAVRQILSVLPKEDLDHVFGHPVFATALHVATQNKQPNLVGFLLEKGADPNVRDLVGKKYSPLHYAAENGDSVALKTLLKFGADCNAKEGEFSRSCLHLLTKSWKSNEDEYCQCVDALLEQKKIKVDVQDSSGASPLFLAAQKGWEYLARKLILNGANIDLKVGTKTVAEIIRKKLPGLIESIDFATIEKPKRYYGEELYEALRNKDLDEFLQIIQEIPKDEKRAILDEDHGEYTVLQHACDYGYTDFVEVILREGADPSKKDPSSKYTPVLYACRKGYLRILELLVKYLGSSSKLGCLSETDRKNETVLHKLAKKEYAAGQSKLTDYDGCLRLLLSLGKQVNTDAQDDFGNTALHYAVLCDDQSLVRQLLLHGAHLGIKNHFGTLAITRIQPSVLEEVLNDCIKHRKSITDGDFAIIFKYRMLVPAQNCEQPETECLKFLSGSKLHRHLLRHPIIDTFLFLKWQRIRQYYFFNILAYFIFLAFLTAYIFIYHGFVDERDLYPLARNESSGQTDDDTFRNNMALSIFLKVIITIMLTYVTIREIMQLIVSWKSYIRQVENWMLFSIICLTTLLLYVPLNYKETQSVAAWLILFSWTELVLVLGRHPWLAVYITMFGTVSFNFLKFIAMFSFIILAFSFSFYLMFQLDETYATYTKTLLRTTAMFTGELEYTDMPLDFFPTSSHLLFVLFVFVIVLVLMNLLNGLAVSDIQQIQQEAELVSYSSRVELISYIESVFLAKPFQKFLSYPCCSKEDCFRADCLVSSNPATKIMNWLGRKTLMFRTCLKNQEIVVYPNRDSGRWFVCNCHSFQLEEKQIEAAKSVILMAESHVADRLTSIEKRLDEALSAIATLSKMVESHVLLPSTN